MTKRFRTGDQALIRDVNRSILLNLLRVYAPQSRADLAAMTGLNKTTVSSVVAELIKTRLVREIGQANSAGGRPAVLLELNPEAGCIIGVELGVWFIKIVLTDFRAGVLWRQELALNSGEDPEAALAKLIQLVRQAVSLASEQGRPIFGLGLGVPGMLDTQSGVLLFGQNMGWYDTPLRQRLTDAFDFPIFIDNDAKASAFGEHYFGVAQHANEFLYVCANIGLGVGVWLDDQVYRGATGFAGEFGHTTFVPGGLLCSCGNHGCWETIASQRALIARLRDEVAKGCPTSLPVHDGALGAISMPMIVQAAQAGDALTLRALEETGEYLGLFIANLINAFNPSLIVFGGALSLAADFLLPPIQRTVAERTMRWPREAVQIAVAAHGFDSCVMGGVALVLNDILRHPQLEMSSRRGPSSRRPVQKEVVPDSQRTYKLVNSQT